MSYFCSRSLFSAEAFLRQSKRSNLQIRRCLPNLNAYYPIIGVNQVSAKIKYREQKCDKVCQTYCIVPIDIF